MVVSAALVVVTSLRAGVLPCFPDHNPPRPPCSYYMASASFYGSNATSYWPSLAARDAFISSFNRLPLSSDMSSMDGFHLQAWADASSLLVPLCRANNTAAFKVRSSFPNVSAAPHFITTAH